MGGLDKGLQNFNGIPLALQILKRLGPQVERVMINANRNLAAYASLGAEVWPDASADFAGPLSGFLVGLSRAETPYVLTVPCDTPRLPLDLAERLATAMVRDNADIAMAAAPETNDKGQTQVRTQPVFCLIKVELADSLVKFTQAGGRKIDAWTSQHQTVIVPFDLPSDDPLAFTNVNTLSELQALENATP
jgi:molybdopterin-guanine dinucleotide biosynthesis protein A